MSGIILIDHMFLELGTYDGTVVKYPKYRCSRCSKAIKQEFADDSGTTVCSSCYKGQNKVGTYLDRVFAISFYLKQKPDHDLTNKIKAAKNGKYSRKMAAILTEGIERFDDLKDYDLIVVPPSGEADELGDNHMVPIGGDRI